MSISFEPMRQFMADNNISYYFLIQNGIDPQTVERLKKDKSITTATLDKLCRLLNRSPDKLIAYTSEEKKEYSD